MSSRSDEEAATWAAKAGLRHGRLPAPLPTPCRQRKRGAWARLRGAWARFAWYGWVLAAFSGLILLARYVGRAGPL